MTSPFFEWLATEAPAVFDTRVLNVALWKWLALLTLVVVILRQMTGRRTRAIDIVVTQAAAEHGTLAR